MNLRRQMFKIHRWLGLVISLQLLAWSVGGLYFTLFDISEVRGTADSAAPDPGPVALPDGAITVAAAIATAEAAGLAAPPASAALLGRRGRLVWELRDADGDPFALVDVDGGELLPPVSETEARAIALADFAHPAEVVSTRLIEDDPPGEFRGGPLPVWRVDLDHAKGVHLYIDPLTGRVLARRNRVWRVFDFFWMLHIMDYDEREDFHHPLLTTASALAVLTSLSGIALWGWRIRSALNRRGRPDG